MNQIIATVVSVAALAGVAAYEGIRFGFWNDADPRELETFVERLKSVPDSFGEWSSQAAKTDESQFAAGGVRGHVARDYENTKTGAKVNVYLVCGKTHPMAIHSPDMCYTAAGFAAGEKNHQYIEFGDRVGEFWFSRFTRDNSLNREELDILWAWTGEGGQWEAPSNPRPHFSDKNALYKLYLISHPGTTIGPEPASHVFLKEFLPILDKVLFEQPQPQAQPQTQADASG
jgi:hypothetical protein